MCLRLIIFLWFYEIILEKNLGSHNSLMGSLFRGGMMLFILREVCFFFGFFWRFFYYRINPLFLNIKKFNSWPPFLAIDTWRIPFIKTLFLVCSGVTLTWSHHIILRYLCLNKTLFFFVNLGFFFTIALGGVFEAFQFKEYLFNFFSINRTVYGSKFYLLTGFHGFHVLMGLFILIIVWARFNCGHFKRTEHNHLLLGAWYWHFVDVVWLFLFVFVYYFFKNEIVL